MRSHSRNERRRCRPLLGTFVEIGLCEPNEALRNRAFASAYAAMEKVQRLMSFHEPSSDVSRLNREACRHAVPVHDWTWEVLVRSGEFASKSQGAFDITIAPLLKKWGYLPKQFCASSDGTFRDIILKPSGVAVRFGRPLEIDLGGIAKGFAVDRAIDSLRALGVKSATVNAGGDMRTLGPKTNWICLRDPAMPGRSAGMVQLRNRAIATSGVYFSRRTWRGTAVSPLVDTKANRPFIGDISVTVSAPDCLTADALTKIVLIQREDSIELLRTFKANAVILERGKVPKLLSSHEAKFS